MTADPAETPKRITVGGGFHVRQAVDNIAWIDMGEDALVVDALEQPELEAEVFEAIRSTIGEKPIRYVLNTHTHYDHVALNAAFKRRFGAEIVNQHTARIPPDGRWFEGPRRRALMLPLGGCHTAEDCVVWFPEDRALFTGDLFGWGLIPLLRGLTDETARLLLAAYARMIEFDAAVVIPGHGPLCSTSELERWLDYFRWLGHCVQQAHREGKSDRQILKGMPPPADMRSWWRFELWKHEDSLHKVLRAVRRGWTPPEVSEG